jgi:hypothetical protein
MPLIAKAASSCELLYEQEEPLYEKQGTHPKHKTRVTASPLGTARYERMKRSPNTVAVIHPSTL